MKPGEIPFTDLGNQLLAETPAQFTTAVADTPVGQRLAVTIRTASTTLTVLLKARDARLWAAQFTRDAAACPGEGLVVAPPMPNGHGKAAK